MLLLLSILFFARLIRGVQITATPNSAATFNIATATPPTFQARSYTNAATFPAVTREATNAIVGDTATSEPSRRPTRKTADKVTIPHNTTTHAPPTPSATTIVRHLPTTIGQTDFGLPTPNAAPRQRIFVASSVLYLWALVFAKAGNFAAGLEPGATMWLRQPLEKRVPSTEKPAYTISTTTAASLPPCPIFTDVYTAVGTVALVWGCTYDPYAPIDVPATMSAVESAAVTEAATTTTFASNQTAASSTSTINASAPGPIASILAINAASVLRPAPIFRVLVAILQCAQTARATSSAALSIPPPPASRLILTSPPIRPSTTTPPRLLPRYSLPPVTAPLTGSPLFAVVLPIPSRGHGQGQGATQDYTTFMLSGFALQPIPATGEPAWHSLTVFSGDTDSWTTALQRIAGLLAIVEAGSTDRLLVVPAVTSGTRASKTTMRNLGTTTSTKTPEAILIETTLLSATRSEGIESLLVVKQTRTVVLVAKTRTKAGGLAASSSAMSKVVASNSGTNAAMAFAVSGVLMGMSCLGWAWEAFYVFI